MGAGPCAHPPVGLGPPAYTALGAGTPAHPNLGLGPPAKPGWGLGPLPPPMWGQENPAGSAGQAPASHEPGQLVPVTAPASFRQPEARGEFWDADGAGGGTSQPSCPSLASPSGPQPAVAEQELGHVPEWGPPDLLDVKCLGSPFCASEGPTWDQIPFHSPWNPFSWGKSHPPPLWVSWGTPPRRLPSTEPSVRAPGRGLREPRPLRFYAAGLRKFGGSRKILAGIGFGWAGGKEGTGRGDAGAAPDFT